MRCFLGCDLSAQAKLGLDSWRDKALRVDGQYQTVKPASFHITTWFLGSISPAQLDQLVQYIEHQLPQQPLSPFELTLDDIVAWSKPKIVAAVPLMPPDVLKQLHYFCKRASDAVNIPAKGNHDTYRPHVTLMRKTRPEQVSAPLFSPSIQVQVSQLHLFESISGQRGVHYVSRFSFSLPTGLSIRESLMRGIGR
jgi:2'-5' RNA ligase